MNIPQETLFVNTCVFTSIASTIVLQWIIDWARNKYNIKL